MTKTLLRRIVGRVIEKMKDYFLSWGAIYIPLAFVFFIFAVQQDESVFFGIMAIIALIAGGLRCV